MKKLRAGFPNDTQRISIVGATGTGKTLAALWHLSRRNYDVKPWVIYDFKIDRNINSIQGAQYLNLDAPIPDYPGIYIVNPRPDQQPEVSDHMMKIWAHQNVGVYVDEGLMMGNNNPGFRALLTQGRSKHIPMIILSQRPVWMDRFVFSESEYFQVFRLQHSDDLKSVNKFIPYSLEKRLPQYNSYYYDVNENAIFQMTPVPDIDATMSTFDLKLRTLKKVV